MENTANTSVNGATSPTVEQNGQAQNGSAQTMHQAEEMADRLLERVSGFAAWLSRGVQRLAARAREEATDIWAEAEHLRKSGQKPEDGGQRSEVRGQKDQEPI